MCTVSTLQFLINWKMLSFAIILFNLNLFLRHASVAKTQPFLAKTQPFLAKTICTWLL